MGKGKSLLDRLRNDGTSWAQPLFDEAADAIASLQREIERAREPYGPDMSDTANHIALLEMERDGMRLQVADLERRLAETKAHIAELSAHVNELARRLTAKARE